MEASTITTAGACSSRYASNATRHATTLLDDIPRSIPAADLALAASQVDGDMVHGGLLPRPRRIDVQGQYPLLPKEAGPIILYDHAHYAVAIARLAPVETPSTTRGRTVIASTAAA